MIGALGVSTWAKRNVFFQVISNVWCRKPARHPDTKQLNWNRHTNRNDLLDLGHYFKLFFFPFPSLSPPPALPSLSFCKKLLLAQTNEASQWPPPQQTGSRSHFQAGSTAAAGLPVQRVRRGLLTAKHQLSFPCTSLQTRNNVDLGKTPPPEMLASKSGCMCVEEGGRGRAREREDTARGSLRISKGGSNGTDWPFIASELRTASSLESFNSIAGFYDFERDPRTLGNEPKPSCLMWWAVSHKPLQLYQPGSRNGPTAMVLA